MTITLDVPPEMEGQLQKIATAQGSDVATLLLESARLQLRPDVLPEAEDHLLRNINAPIAPEARLQRDTLLAAQSQRDLTLQEQMTLATLIDTVEIAHAAR